MILNSRMKKIDGLAAAGIFVFLAGLYTLTAAPSIMFEDTGEFAMSAMSLGVSHPPGYPLFVMMGRLFQWLPAGGAAFALTLMSATLGAAAMSVLYAACRRFGFGAAASAAGALLMGVSRTFWSQCSIQEVYALNALLNCGLLWAAAVFISTGPSAGMLAAAPLLALSALNHYTTPAAFIPLFAGLLAAGRKSPARGRAAIAVAALFTIATFTFLYSAIPLRAAANPFLNWRNPTAPAAFLEHIKRSQFGQWENQLAFDINTYVKFLASFIGNLSGEFTAALVFVAFFGAALLYAEKKKVFASMAWLFISQSALILLYARFNANEMMFSVARVFYIGAYLEIAVLAAAGLDRLTGANAGKFAKPAGAAAVALAAIPMFLNFSSADMRHADDAPSLARETLKNLRRDSALILQGTHFTAPVAYLRHVEGMRPDALLVDANGNILRDSLEKPYGEFDLINIDFVIDRLASDIKNSREVAMTFQQPLDGLAPVFKMRGPLFYYSDHPECQKGREGWERFAEPPEGETDKDYESIMLRSFVKSRQAECAFLNNDNGLGLTLLSQTARGMSDNTYTALMAGQIADAYGYDRVALEYYKKSLESCPTFTDALVRMAQLYTKLLENVPPEKRAYVQPEELYEKALKIAPDDLAVRIALANIAFMNADMKRAESLYLDILKERPESVTAQNSLANVYVRMTKDDLALERYEAALALAPDSATTIVNASGFYMKRGQHKLAIELLRRLLEKKPEAPYGNYNIGLAFQETGSYNTALDHYRTAVKYAPGLKEGWENLALLQIKMRKYEEALDTIGDMKRQGGPAMKEASEALWATAVKGMSAAGMKDRAAVELELMKATKSERLKKFAEELEKVMNRKNIKI